MPGDGQVGARDRPVADPMTHGCTCPRWPCPDCYAALGEPMPVVQGRERVGDNMPWWRAHMKLRRQSAGQGGER